MSEIARPTRVLHLTNLYPTTAAPVFGVFVKEQIESIDRFSRSGEVEQFVEIIQGRDHGRRAYIDMVRRLRGIVLDQRIEVIHAHHLLSGLVAGVAGVRVPTVVSFMNEPGHQLHGWPSWVERAMYGFVLATSAHGIYKARPPASAARHSATFLPNGVDLGTFAPVHELEAREALGIPANAIVLMFVSANDLDRPAKRRDRFRDVCRIVKANLQAQVWPIEASRETRERLRLMYSAADCYVLTSDHEGSPNSVKEALACNCRVVATPVGSVPETLKGVAACAIAGGFDAVELAAEVARVCRLPRPDGRSALTARGLDQESVARELVRLYRALAKVS